MLSRSQSIAAVVATISLLAMLQGCGEDPSSRTPAKESSPTPTKESSPTPAKDSSPEAWVMSPDSFGPITFQTTPDEARDSGHYKDAPSPCTGSRLDWKSQKYETLEFDSDDDGTPDRDLAEPYMPSLSIDGSKILYIMAGQQTRTDRGIKAGSSLAELRAAYGDRLIEAFADVSIYAVHGRRSSLIIGIENGKVYALHLQPGRIRASDEPGIGGLC